MIRRILTAAILIPLIVALVLRGSLYMMVAGELVFILTALWEYFRLARAVVGGQLFARLGYAFGFAVGLLPLTSSVATHALALLLFYSVLALTLGQRSCRNVEAYLPSVSASVFGLLYTAVPLALLVAAWKQSNGPVLVLFLFVVVWTGDTVAFFVGKLFGRHKMAPRISPGKTWEGAVGSLVMALVVGFVFSKYWAGGGIWPLPLAVALNISAQVGDLAESALKRNAGVKDSSQLVPGHGGVLDRIDALLFAAPVLWYYQVLFPG